jgi:hypothetical protein
LCDHPLIDTAQVAKIRDEQKLVSEIEEEAPKPAAKASKKK